MPRGPTAWWADGVTRWARVGLLQKISWRPRWTLSHTTAASRCSRKRGWSPGWMLMYLIGSALSYRTRNLPYDKSGQTMVCAGGKDKDACQVSQFKCNHFFCFASLTWCLWIGRQWRPTCVWKKCPWSASRREMSLWYRELGSGLRYRGNSGSLHKGERANK